MIYWQDQPIVDRLAIEGQVCFFDIQILPKFQIIAGANVSERIKTRYDDDHKHDRGLLVAGTGNL